MSLLLQYDHLQDLLDETIKDEHERMIKLQQRMIDNCQELIMLIEEDRSAWSIKTKGLLSVLQAHLEDDQVTTRRLAALTNS